MTNLFPPPGQRAPLYLDGAEVKSVISRAGQLGAGVSSSLLLPSLPPSLFLPISGLSTWALSVAASGWLDLLHND